MSKWCARQNFLLLLWRHFNLPIFNIVTFFGVSSDSECSSCPFLPSFSLALTRLTSISISDQKLNYEYCKRWTDAMSVSPCKSKVVNCVCRENYQNPIVMISIYLTAPLWSCKNDEPNEVNVHWIAWQIQNVFAVASFALATATAIATIIRLGRWLITFSRSNAIVLLITLRRLSEHSLQTT